MVTAEQGVIRDVPEGLVVINPLECPEWDSVVSKHPESSFFHSAGWARVLHATYRHCPFYFCGFAEKRLRTLLPIMEVSSAVTGRRGVSLPFSDFCGPLTEEGNAGPLYEAALEYGRSRKWTYLECRNSSRGWPAVGGASVTFWGHVIDLKDGEEALFSRLSGSVRRGVRKAENLSVRVEFSNSLEGVKEFYALHCPTRKRHGLPPQPFRFFDNIARHVLAAGHGFVATARLGQKPLAASLFFHSASEVIYKFGASDHSFQQLRPSTLLMWEAIRRCAASGFAQLHLGRTSHANEGLRKFKVGFGAREEAIEYRRYDFRCRTFVTSNDRAKNSLNRVCQWLPLGALRLAGETMYPHLS